MTTEKDQEQYPKVTLHHEDDKKRKLVVTSLLQYEAATKMGFVEVSSDSDASEKLDEEPSKPQTKSQAQIKDEVKRVSKIVKRSNK